MHTLFQYKAGHPCQAAQAFTALASKYACRKISSRKRQRLNSIATDDQQVLHTFWRARGVTDHQHREKLIEVALQDQPTEPTGEIDTVLPGAHAYWQLDTRSESRPQVRAISAKLLELRAALGKRPDVDVGAMLIACPQLLRLELPDMMQRLLTMQVAVGAESLDICKVVEAQPSLLLKQSSGEESPDAWLYGLHSDDWSSQVQALKAFGKQYGHIHIGFGGSEDSELAKFARMQRAAWKKGSLASDRAAMLEGMGFILDADDAEWEFMVSRLELAQAGVNRDNPLLDGGFDFLLNNWCSVQRISQRSGVLSPQRVSRLDALNFDWTGADALS